MKMLRQLFSSTFMVLLDLFSNLHKLDACEMDSLALLTQGCKSYSSSANCRVLFQVCCNAGNWCQNWICRSLYGPNRNISSIIPHTSFCRHSTGINKHLFAVYKILQNYPVFFFLWSRQRGLGRQGE